MIYSMKSTPEIEELITAWKTYISTVGDWQGVVKDTAPKQTFCGPIYEPKSPLNRPNESFAISDMRQVKVAEPHYHTGGETEIYFVLSGNGLTVVGGEELQVKQGDVIVTPPETAHFTIPEEGLVMIVINTPPFNPENNIGIDTTKPELGYDHDQYKKLTARL